MSRSTFAGSGKYAGHWTGDNESRPEFMGSSISSAHLFNFFGIPFVGSDVCGFNGNTTAYDCAKWYKIAAISPFARNHNNIDSESQEPYIDRFKVKIDVTYNKTAQQIIQKASLIRYGLHVYTYTQYHKATTDGIPPFRPLFFDFPDDKYAYDYTESNVMLGDSLKASPHFGVSERNTYYFPGGSSTLWCPIYNTYYNQCFEGGSYQSISISYSEFMLHIRSGSVVPLQLTDTDVYWDITGIRTLSNMYDITTDLSILTDNNKKAAGFVRFDGGETTDMTLYDEIKFDVKITDGFFSNTKMDVNFTNINTKNTVPKTKHQQLGALFIHKADRNSFRDKTTGKIYMKSGMEIPITAHYDPKRDICTINHDETIEVYFRDIKGIHLDANQ